MAANCPLDAPPSLFRAGSRCRQPDPQEEIKRFLIVFSSFMFPQFKSKCKSMNDSVLECHSPNVSSHVVKSGNSVDIQLHLDNVKENLTFKYYPDPTFEIQTFKDLTATSLIIVTVRRDRTSPDEMQNVSPRDGNTRNMDASPRVALVNVSLSLNRVKVSPRPSPSAKPRPPYKAYRVTSNSCRYAQSSYRCLKILESA